MAEFTAPTAEQGDHVLFYEDADPNSNPWAAVVIKARGGTLDLQLIRAGDPAFRYGVAHRDDPQLQQRPEFRRHGCWEEGAMLRRVRVLEGAVAELMGLGRKKADVKT